MLTPKQVLAHVQANASYLQKNAEAIDIFEGNLEPYIVKDLKDQLSLQSFTQAIFRMVPINILPKIIDKLTNIYQTCVQRQVFDGRVSDKELLAWYVEKMKTNVFMNAANEMFNLNKSALIQPYAHQLKPCLRVILNDRFVVVSTDPIDPTIPTDVIVLAGTVDDKQIYWVYSQDAFYICDSEEKIRTDLMARYGNPDGINPIGRLPFIYVNESKYRLRPKHDTDLIKLTKVIPIMLTDLNHAAMFQCFSILFGIDLDDEGLKYAPNAFWRLKSDPTSDKKPEIGSIKPQVDYDQVISLVMTELSMWLSSRGIRASSVGQLTSENFASGISKVVDEMDTYEARQKQTSYFEDAELNLWDLVLKYMHPYWSATGQVENTTQFTPTATVKTTFAIQLPLQSRGELVRDLKDEYSAGFISRRRAMMKLNPELTEEEIEELIEEIDEERTVTNGVEEETEAETEGVLEDGGEVAEGESRDSDGARSEGAA